MRLLKAGITDYNNGIHSSIATDANTHTLTVSNNTIVSGNNGVRIDQNVGDVIVALNNNAFSGLYDSAGVY